MIQAGRRELIGLCARALLVAPLVGHAQPAGRTYRIGYLSPLNPDSPEFAAFKMGLSRFGWEEHETSSSKSAGQQPGRKA